MKVKIVPAAGTKTAAYFTIGSTKDEVVAIQGTPGNASDYSFSYGSSYVFFDNGRVSSWNDGQPALKVKLVPAAGTKTAANFTIGSTKDEVVAIQGTPDNASDYSFSYGSSYVFFDNGRVSSWNNGQPALKVKIVPAAGTKVAAYFTIGSTKDEVVAIQGTPDNASDYSFSYGSSYVFFDNGRVSSWNNGNPALKAQLKSKGQTPERP